MLRRIATAQITEIPQFWAEAAARYFDLSATVCVACVKDEASAERCVQALAEAANNLRILLEGQLRDRPSLQAISRDILVKSYLAVEQRKELWTSEALKLLRITKAATLDSAPASVPQVLKPGLSSTVAPTSSPRPERTDRRAAVDAYLKEASAHSGKRVTRTAFWKIAGYQSRTEFERWQRHDRLTTKAASRAFERVLREKPHCR